MRNLVALSIVVGLGLAVTFVFAEEEGKLTTKQVMKMAHGGGANSLRAKVLAGTAGEEDTKKLLELYTALSKNEPKKGEADAWKAKTEAIVGAAKGVVEGKDGSKGDLEKATNCMACHSAHK